MLKSLPMNKKNVALVGLGTVGTGVYHILKDSLPIKDAVNLYAFCDLDKAKCPSDEDILYYADYHEVLNDDKIDIVVEMMGGERIAYDLIKNALLKKKSVVTSNKEVVANHIEEFLALSKENDVCFLFEASVGGGVPIIQNIAHYAKVNDISSIEGMLNGSTNFVLTKIQEEHMPLEKAMELAFQKGFLERDPSADLDGLDMMRKIAILSDLAYHTKVPVEKVHNFSLKNVSDDFISFVNKQGYKLKYMAESKKDQNKVTLRIEPCAVKKDSLAAGVMNELNYISYLGNYIQKLEFTGCGAGMHPTATAVASDIAQIALENLSIYDPLDNQMEYISSTNEKYTFFVEEKEECVFPKSYIEEKIGSYIITKKISCAEIDSCLPQIQFYAKVK